MKLNFTQTSLRLYSTRLYSNMFGSHLYVQCSEGQLLRHRTYLLRELVQSSCYFRRLSKKQTSAVLRLPSHRSRVPPPAVRRRGQQSWRSESGRRRKAACGGQARHLRPAVRSRVVDLRRAEAPPGAPPAEDVELASHRCGGVNPPSGAHASQLRPRVGLRVVHVGWVHRAPLAVFPTPVT